MKKKIRKQNQWQSPRGIAISRKTHNGNGSAPARISVSDSEMAWNPQSDRGRFSPKARAERASLVYYSISLWLAEREER